MQRVLGLLAAVISLCFCYQKDGQCYKSLNLVIALDSSGSINIASWLSGINLSKQIVQSLAFADSGNKFAIIEFSSTANVTHQLSSASSSVISSLDNIKDRVKGGHTYIDAGLNEALRIFDAAKIDKTSTQNVLLTVTDGFMTYRDGQDIFDIMKTPIEQLKAKSVELYAASVGSMVKERTLQFIASDPTSVHVFKSDQASNMVEGIKRLTETECPTIVCSTVKVSRAEKGCYKDNQQKTRPLPYLTFTDRDQGSKKFSGVQLTWKNWGSYVRDLVCRCAEAVAKEGRYILGLQYYGECWSSIANNTYALDGAADDPSKCVSDTGQTCNSTMLYCVGTGLHNFVYKISLKNG